MASHACLSRRLLECGSCSLEGLHTMEEAADFIKTASGHYAFSPNAGVFITPNGIFENYGPSHRFVGALTIGGGCRQLTTGGEGSWPHEQWWWMFDRWYVQCEYHDRVLTTKEELLEVMPSGGSRFREPFGWLDDDLRCFSLGALRPAPVAQPRAGELLHAAGDGLPYTMSESIALGINLPMGPRYEHPLVEAAAARQTQEGPAWVMAGQLSPPLPPALSGQLGRVLSWEAGGNCIVAFTLPHGAFEIPSECLRAVEGPPWVLESNKRRVAAEGWDAAANPPKAVAPRQLDWAKVSQQHRARLSSMPRGVGPSSASSA